MIKGFKVKLALLLATIMLFLNVTTALLHTNEIVANAASHVHVWHYTSQIAYLDLWWTNAHNYTITQNRYCISGEGCNAYEFVGQTHGSESHSITRTDSHTGGTKHIFAEKCTKCTYTYTNTISCPGNPCLTPW